MKIIMKQLIACLLIVLLLVGCTPKLPDATINGVNISAYTLVYNADDPGYCKRAAQYIHQQVKSRTGVELTVSDSASSFNHEILIGQTDRPLSQSTAPEPMTLDFHIAADENHIAINANLFVIAAAAYYFVQTYIPGNSFQSSIPKDSVTTAQPITQKPDHYIFLIGDGMGDNHIQLLEDHTADPFYGLYLPYRGTLHTDCLTGTTDSAAASTALACGYKTNKGMVGMNPDGEDLQSLTELAGSLGMATAIMTTDRRTGATPSGFTAHAADRDDTDDILADQVQLVEDYGTVFNYGLDSAYSLESYIFETLEQVNASEKGFFLMYEEAHIDKHSHKNDITKTVSVMNRFNQAIGIFMEYAFYHPNTFLIITADHETGGLIPNEENVLGFTQEEHSPVDVSIFGYGQGAEVFDAQAKENNEVAKIIASMWGVKDFGN